MTFGWMGVTLPWPARAQEKYPSRPIDFICTWGTGGGADMMARQVSGLAQPLLGVALPVSNVPGASGSTGLARIPEADAPAFVDRVIGAMLSAS